MLYGLGFDASGKLYGLGSNLDLYSVNTTTAALTLIGSTGANPGSNGISMGNTSDGTIYLESSGVLSTVNTSTAALTTVGNMGIITGSDVNGDASGNLFVEDDINNSLYSLNRTTGAATLIGANSAGTVFGIAYSNGTMYAMQANGYGVYSLNLSNGTSTLVSNYDTAGFGFIETAATDFPSVPEPASVAMLGIGLLGILVQARCRARG